ncbi:MAG: efflux RND transporter periplasmic adaptor subunit [Syntrophales bacterium]|jgi:RND family efflux transporter MFP subunit|nr:efflux RND transporter periplasmic adaptor subunit [Syntrophales bacterium]MCK9391913.1 efflux RND transporter periplasmic adaptor subunit [Syntrophales bacterium]
MKKNSICLYDKSGEILNTLLVLLCLASFIMGGCQGASTTAERPRPTVTDVKVTTVVLSKVDETYETTGTVKSEQVSNVASRIMGVVTAVHVREGDRVKAGQLLTTIDNRELLQKVKGAAMAMETANSNKAMTEITWRRYRQLYAEKAVSQQEMDQVETQKKMADSEYERAKAAYEETGIYEAYAKIKAPVTGIITSKKIDGGSMAVPGQLLLTIESDKALYVEAFAEETLTRRLSKGMTVDVAIEATNRQLRGSIRDIIPVVDPQSRTFLIKIALPTAGLKSGLYARIRIPVGKKETLLVPEGSVVSKGQLSGIYVVAPNGVMTYRLVKTGRTYPDRRIEILSGLAQNEQIVSEGTQRAVDGGVVQKNQLK